MKDGIYHHFAPILFVEPDQMMTDGFLRSPVLINVSSSHSLTVQPLNWSTFVRSFIYLSLESIHSLGRRLVEDPRQGANFTAFTVQQKDL